LSEHTNKGTSQSCAQVLFFGSWNIHIYFISLKYEQVVIFEIRNLMCLQFCFLMQELLQEMEKKKQNGKWAWIEMENLEFLSKKYFIVF